MRRTPGVFPPGVFSATRVSERFQHKSCSWNLVTGPPSPPVRNHGVMLRFQTKPPMEHGTGRGKFSIMTRSMDNISGAMTPRRGVGMTGFRVVGRDAPLPLGWKSFAILLTALAFAFFVWRLCFCSRAVLADATRLRIPCSRPSRSFFVPQGCPSPSA